MFKYISAIAVVILIAFGAYYFVVERGPDFETSDIPAVSFEDVEQDSEIRVDDDAEQDVPEEEIVDEQDEEIPATEEPSENLDGIPVQMNLAVPFTSQAPHSNWSLPYQEACEEASAYMVAEYFNGTPEGQIDADEADAAILEVVAFQEDFWGYYLDTTAAETSQFIDLFYGYGAIVVENPTVEQIKQEIAEGRPVIVPAAGQQLGNPNFTGDGPLYHMLVIKGYTADSFITNDPGTRNGENFVYEIDVIMDAIGDWNNGNPANGEKVVIFVSK